MNSLIIGTGFVGTEVRAAWSLRSIPVIATSRRVGAADALIQNGAELDELIAEHAEDQVIVVGQLTQPDIDWVLERIDGPRWLVISSHQVASATAAPNARLARLREELALGRGACVLRPTMIYGKGKDANVSRLIGLMRAFGIPVVPGSGSQQVQPVHVDDLVDLLARHNQSPRGGLFEVAGPEALSFNELVATLAQIIGLRVPPVHIPVNVLELAARLGPVVGIRSDQIKRLTESKVADPSLAIDLFTWRPAALGLRLEQAVAEVE